MPTTSQDARLTYEDFLLFADDGLRHEVIDGAHYVTLSPNLRHQDLVGRLFRRTRSARHLDGSVQRHLG